MGSAVRLEVIEHPLFSAKSQPKLDSISSSRHFYKRAVVLGFVLRPATPVKEGYQESGDTEVQYLCGSWDRESVTATALWAPYSTPGLPDVLSNPWKEVEQQLLFPFRRQGRLREV